MITSEQHVSISYFGKVPYRGDFIKASDQPALLQVMDQWLTHSMQLLVQDTRWRSYYDGMSYLHFAFLKVGSQHVVAGTLLKSLDSADRRFPLMVLCTLNQTSSPLAVMMSPLLLASPWKQLYEQASRMLDLQLEPWMTTERQLFITNMPLMSQCEGYFEDYLRLFSLGELQRLLTDSGFQGDLRQALIALGVLLQPLLSAPGVRPEKSLLLPLPKEQMHRDLVASFWLRMIMPFLASSDVELSLIVTQFYAPVLVIGFSGASPQQLVAMISPLVRSEHCINVEDSDWVEMQIEESFTLNKFSLYLQQSELSLLSVLGFFEETFLGV